MVKKGAVKENIYNIPNLLTLVRILLGFFIAYLIFAEISMLIVVLAFIFAAVTDFLDGRIARQFNQKTIFGAKFDIISDRIFMAIVGISLFVYYSMLGDYGNRFIIQLVLLMSREIIAFPALLIKRRIPKARFIGKLTTFMQGVTLPMILLNLWFSIYFAVATAIIGVVSGITYSKEVLSNDKTKFH